jgi:spermidine synthase
MKSVKRRRREFRQDQQKQTSPEPSSLSGVELTAKLGGLYFFSGLPALIYQIVWQRLLVLHSGVGTTSVAIIVAAYLLGIGCGSYLGAGLSRRLSPRQAITAFAIFEVAVAICGFISPWVLYDVLYLHFGWAYANVWVAGGLHFAALIVPTTLMGATLPLMTRALVRDIDLAPRSIGILYGMNTLGAAAGAALAPWLLLPWVGVSGTCSVAAAVNFSVALVALRLRGRLSSSLDATADTLGADALAIEQPTEQAALSPAAAAARDTPFAFWVALYFCGGFVAIGLEILWFRILDVAVKSTAYTFGTLLATYLSCMALGSILGSRHMDRVTQPLSHFLWLQWMITASSAASVLLLLYIPSGWWGMSWLYNYWGEAEPIFPSWQRPWATMALYILLPLFLMGYATYCMGYSFCVLQRGVQREARLSGYRVGVLQAVNIAGCIAGSLAVGLWLLSVLGTAATLQVLVALGGGFAVMGYSLCGRSAKFLGCVATTLLAAWLIPSNNAFWLRLHGHDSTSAAVIAEDVTGVANVAPLSNSDNWRVGVNGKAQSNLPFGGFHSKLGAIPSTLHPNPKSIAIIGLGSGNTAWSAACRDETEEITVFEICTAEALLLPHYKRLGNWRDVNTFLDDQRVKIDGRDARFALMTEERQYDLIEADAIRSNGAFAGYLYSVEFFQLCSTRLKTGGLMCTWAPTPGTILTFTTAFPYVLQLDGGYILVGSNQPITLDREAWAAKFDSPRLSTYLGQDVVRECLTSISQATLYLAEPEPGMPNTDLFPFDEFRN